MLIQLTGWCALRFGEVSELRRADIDLVAGVLRIRRGVVRTAARELVIGTPKSEAGSRDVTVPPHLLDPLQAHLDRHVQPGSDALLFPAVNGGNLVPSTLYRVFYRARDKAGRPDLRFHDLRHTGATPAAATGATLAELMARLGQRHPGRCDALPARCAGRRQGNSGGTVGAGHSRVASAPTATSVTAVAWRGGGRYPLGGG